jgi:hypothetical protein
MTILVLTGLTGTIAKATSNFPNANIVLCDSTDDCISNLIDDAGATIAGLYGDFSIDNSNVYTLTDPQLVPLSGLIRRDACPQENDSSESASVALVASYALIALVFVLITVDNLVN